MKTITREIKCGIYDATEIYRIYGKNKMTIRQPYIKWINNSGYLAYRRITVTDPKIIAAIQSPDEDQRFWADCCISTM